MRLSFSLLLFGLALLSHLFSSSLLAASSEWEFFEKFPVAKIRAKPKNIFDLKRNFSFLKRDHLEKIVREFVQASSPNRQVGGKGHKAAQEFIVQAIRKIDLQKKGTVYVDAFKPDIDFAKNHYQKEFEEKVAAFHKKDSPTYLTGLAFTQSIQNFLESQKERRGRHVIWEKKGALRPKEAVVVMAHYDTMSVDEKKHIKAVRANPGADDNGSGVALALSLIKIVAAMDIPVTMRFVFLDWEEWAGLGTKAYLEKYKKEDLRARTYINLEALGHDSRTQDKEERYGNMRAYISKPDQPYYQKEEILLDKMLEKGRKIAGYRLFKKVANAQVLEGDMGRWQDEVPAISFSQNWQDDPNVKRIHTPNDFPETLNFSTLHKCTKFIGGGLLAVLFDL